MAQTTERTAADATATCRYTFDPAKRTDAHLQTTWECPHEAHGDSDYCPFHMSRDERASNDVSAEEIVAQIKENLRSGGVRANEYVGADLPHLSLTYQDIDGGNNHVLNFQYADIEGLDITHGHLEQGLNLRGATVGALEFESATIDGTLDAADLSVERRFSAYETTFREDVTLQDASFHAEVDCDETTFGDDTTFAGATFHGVAHFRNAETTGTSHVLDDNISFADVEFRDDASFRQATFKYVTFENAGFHAESDFEHVEFEGDAQFGDVVFDRMADFDEARFHDDACFKDARFKQLAEFRGVEFNGGSRTTNDDVTFEAATFEDEADFKLARFRFADFKDATFQGAFNLDRAQFDARADCHRIEVGGTAIFERVAFFDGVNFDGSRFEGDVRGVDAEFHGDADFMATTFRSRVRFTEARFLEDASFREATFQDDAVFRGSIFEGEAKHLEENACFDETTFEALADFQSSSFTNGSFKDVTFHDESNFRESEFHNGVEFRVQSGGSADTYVDLTEATIVGGTIVIAAESAVIYDLTKATLGDVRLESEGSDHELLDHFRFCLTDFDHFDFSDHHAYLERNDWNVHDFLGDESSGRYDVEMTSEVVEETYRKAQDSADAVGDTPAMREFEFKRYCYNRKKNLDIVFREYSLNTWGRVKKASSVGLNFFMQLTCGYGNRLPRIAALTFLLPAVFGGLYVLGGPLQTQAGVIWNADQPATTLFEGLYYSYISFSTIGYGDIGPVGWLAKILAASQGMLNGLFFTLLTFTLFKRVLGGN
ncbi:pentapeptide repeat-containing protein [Halorussus pelagicus]|uniref:pentapeptide repeat-containing protein n=1 Tax=Halorussus pelagicus TaxID=2505977 RepID=UPI000FFB3938|nr:pentapeptide repeat-containing protein [Halorussus pelagicus]